MRSLVLIAALAITPVTFLHGRVAAASVDTSPRAPKTHEVRMLGGRYSPYELTIAPGDTVKFVLGSGGPHNVAFRETTGAPANHLRKLMAGQIDELSGPLLIIPGETYSVVFSGMPAGKYPYWCIPHLAMGQMGSITVK